MNSRGEMELNWQQITCKRSVAGEAFSQGIQEYSFSVSGKNAWIPSMSYFLVQAKLEMAVRDQPLDKLGGDPDNENKPFAVADNAPLSPAIWRMPYLSDSTTFSDHFASNLYNNAFFRAGNQDLSSCTQYLGQSSVMKQRLNQSHAWQKNVGAKLSMEDSDFTRRLNRVSLDGIYHEDGLRKAGSVLFRPMLTDVGVVVPNRATGGAVTTTTGAYVAATGVLTLAGAPAIDALVSAIAPDDTLQFDNGGATLLLKVISVLTATTVRVTPINASNADVAGLTFESCNCQNDAKCGFNNIQSVFRPSLGIWDINTPLFGGDMRFDLNPNSNFERSAVESIYNLAPGTDYRFTISNVYLYVATVKLDVSPSGIIPLSLKEMTLLNKSLTGTGAGASVNVDFIVPPSTLYLTVFLQTAKSGNRTDFPTSKFISATPNEQNEDNNSANNISTIQVTYGNVTKTQTLYTSRYAQPQPVNGLVAINQEGVNYNIQRWYQTNQYAGMSDDAGGSESHDAYIDHGGMYFFDWTKDKNDTSSYVNVQISYNSNIDPSDQLFLVATYSRQAEIQYENGYITQVVTVNR